EQDQAIEEFILKEGNLKFDLENDPLIRVSVLQRSEKESILVFCEHHIIHDGWTQGILLREFIDTYEKLLHDSNYTLSKPKLQFKDFAYWQRNYFTNEILEKHANFWIKKLEGHKAVLPLPTKGNRPKEITGNGRLLEFIIEDDFAKEIREFSQKHNATLFITMLAAFKTVLSYFSHETDICIGAAAANRRLASVSDMLGMIINTLAVRTQFDKHDSLFDIFTKVRESCFETYAYEDTPFDKVVQFTNAERDLSINPIFQYNFSFMNTPSRNLHLPDLELEILDSHNQTAKFDINVVVVTPLEQNQQEEIEEDSMERIIVEWEYNSDIFTEELMQLMIKAYSKFLKLIVSKGDLPFSTVHPLEEDILSNLASIDSNENIAQESVLNLFLNQVSLFPNKKALVFENTVYSYKELDEISNQIACYLSDKQRIKTGDIVAIYLDRTAWQIISILAIIKLGAAYLPIKYQAPEKR
ncbi:MAG: condensation domain-containing protein, partial [Bacteroidota bacterium]